ncbi:MAG: hypothetical protein ABUS57_18260, partial [Pseudomonadota bacterium]
KGSDMIVLLWALTAFNAAAGLGGLMLAFRLTTAEERAHWRSKRLLRIADAFAWVLPILALAATILAWMDLRDGRPAGALMAMLPIVWLVVMGAVFAIVDFAEDGILGNGRM